MIIASETNNSTKVSKYDLMLKQSQMNRKKNNIIPRNSINGKRNNFSLYELTSN